MWGFLALFALIAVTHGSPVVENDATTHTSLETLLNSLGPNPSFTIYSVKSFEASSFVTQLNEVQQEEFYGIELACDAMPVQHNLCLQHPASCQSTNINIINFENAVTTHSHSLHSIKRVCEPNAFPPSKVIIDKCHQGLKWNPVWNATEKFSLLTLMFEGFTREYL